MTDSAPSAVEYVFVDEAGTVVLGGDGSKPDIYVVTGVHMPSVEIAAAEEKARRITRTHAKDGELKSSKIANNLNRRAKVLQDIARAGFCSYSLVIDKRKISIDSGLRWKPSSYKYLHRMFVSSVSSAFQSLDITADKFGSIEFMKSVEDYLRKRGELFDRLSYLPSKDSPLLQVADVIAGTIRRVFEGNDPTELLTYLGYPSMPIEVWPPVATGSASTPACGTNEKSEDAVRSLAVRQARRFVEDNLDSSDLDDRVRAEAIRFLLRRLYEDPTEYVYRDEVVSHVKSVTGVALTVSALTTSVLADARDDGVIIASTDRGVKIPYSIADLAAWVKRVEAQTVPYLQRLGSARRLILTATHSSLDIVTNAEFPVLAHYLAPVWDTDGDTGS